MNQTDTRTARIRFSDKLAAMLVYEGPITLAIALARVEWSTAESGGAYVPCEWCPYASKSHHEASLHALFHDPKSKRKYHLNIRQL